jgi:hypothetical protein
MAAYVISYVRFLDREAIDRAISRSLILVDGVPAAT